MTAAIVILCLYAISLKNFWLARAFFKFDWPKESFILCALSQSLKEFKSIPKNFYTIPPEISYFPSFYPTRGTFKNPEVLYFSPLMIFMPFISSLRFYKLYLAVHVLLATISMHLICNSLNLSLPLEFLFLTITIFHPWLMQHVCIGYSPWATAGLIPSIIYLTYFHDLNFLSQFSAGLIAALIVYAGGFHVFVWILMALSIFTLYSLILSQNIDLLIKSTVFVISAVALSAPRLIASSRAYSGFVRGINTSYRSLNDILGLLTDRKSRKKPDQTDYSNLYNTTYYDAAMACGYIWLTINLFVVGHLLLDYFFFNTLYSHKIAFTFSFSALTFLLLGWDKVWESLAKRIPVLSCQIYPYRFLHIAVFFQSATMIFYLNDILTIYHAEYFQYLVWALAAYFLTVFFMENRFFASDITNGDGIWFDCSLTDFWKITQISTTFPGQRIFTPTSTPNEIILELQDDELLNQELLLPWLPYNLIKDFEIEGGTFLEEASFTLIKPIQKRIKLIPKLF